MRRLAIAALVVVALGITAGAALAGGTKTSVIYDSSAKNGQPSNLPSAGPEAYAFSKMYEGITFAGGPRKLQQRHGHAQQLGVRVGNLDRGRLRHTGRGYVRAAGHPGNLRLHRHDAAR